MNSGTLIGDLQFDGFGGFLTQTAGSIAGNLDVRSGVGGVVLSGGSITGDIDFANGGLLDVSGGSVDGNITFGAGGPRLTLSGGSITGNLDFGAGFSLLAISGGSISGDMDGGAGFDTLALDIAGPFDLGNVNAGQATLSAGTTIVNGTLVANTTLEAGALLLGTGTVTGNVSNLGGFSPGGSIGTTTINGNYTQGAGGALNIEIAADGSSDLLAITGTAVLDGALDITGLDGPIAVGTSYTILTASGGISGSFASFTLSIVTAPLAQPVLTIGANSVTFRIVVAVPVPVSSPALLALLALLLGFVGLVWLRYRAAPSLDAAHRNTQTLVAQRH